MSDIVFLVESVDRYGRPYTIGDRLKSLSPEWIEHYNSEIISTYVSCIGKKITFQPYSSVHSFDANKKYYYFIVIDHFNHDFAVYFQMLGKSKLKRLHDNNIPLYFAHDTETIPHVEYSTFVKQLEWLFLMRNVYSDVHNEIIVATTGGLVPRQSDFIKQYFYNRFKFIQTPLILKYSVNELISTCPTEDEIERLNSTLKYRQFIFLNRAARYHRTMLLHGIRAQGLIDNGYISYTGACHYDANTIISQTDYARAVRDDVNRGPLPILKLDEYEFTDNRPRSIPLSLQQLWRSYYDIVSETGVLYSIPDHLDLTIVSEKTAKSMLLMRPFMVNGGPYVLKTLQRWGFKTYDFIFDESYDIKENVIDRHEIILNNVKRYRDNLNDLDNVMIDAKKISKYNRHHLLNADYEQLLINELVSIQ